MPTSSRRRWRLRRIHPTRSVTTKPTDWVRSMVVLSVFRRFGRAAPTQVPAPQPSQNNVMIVLVNG